MSMSPSPANGNCAPVVFLDRDGVINRDSDRYIKRWAEFVFLPGSLEALARLTAAGLGLVVITNQSAVGRGMISLAGLQEIHRRMTGAIEAAGGRLLDILFCPHRPDEACDCRKPATGLIAEACRRHGLDPARAVMVGDRATDIRCGRGAGCRATVLVGVDDRARALAELSQWGIVPDRVAPDLAGACDWIIRCLTDPDLP
jgi:D-glycero-D-manno-heptose 1,7-bisphosphate phosphatase